MFYKSSETKELLVSMKFCQKVTDPYVHYGTKLVSSKYTSVTSSAGCKLPTWVFFFFFFFCKCNIREYEKIRLQHGFIRVCICGIKGISCDFKNHYLY